MNSILKIPFFGYLVRIFLYIVKLPTKMDAVQHSLEDSKNIQSEQFKRSEQIQNNIDILDRKLSGLSKSIDSLIKSVEFINSSGVIPKKNHTQNGVRFADNHSLDIFYTNFEDRFRGDEKSIKKRLFEHLDYFKNSNINFKKYPVLDIGSGRGEFIELLKENDINAIGLDINLDMVKRSLNKGLRVEQGDVYTYLLNNDSKKFGAITGFHIVEHIPFEELINIFKVAYSSLVDGGFVLFETPNPENVIVGSCAFYTDPSHLNPIPPELLAFAIEESGFSGVQIIRLHPVKTDINPKDLPEEFLNRFFGPRDYAVLGYK